MSEIYDLIILGAGPAGIGAAIYASRAKLNMLWIEKKFVQGGQITDTYEVDNYPGMPGISGMELGEAMAAHVEKLGASPVRENVISIEEEEGVKIVRTKKHEYRAKTLIIALGAAHRKLGIPGEEELASGLDRDIQAVGVFVNAPETLAAELLNRGIISMAQLHGQEDEVYIRRLRKLTDRPPIKAFSVGSREDAEKALESSADYILLDQGKGGTGIPFDWSLLPVVERPFFLAGGLGEDNLERAVRRFHPYAVDLSSGVETDMWKDPVKIKKAVDILRRFRI